MPGRTGTTPKHGKPLRELAALVGVSIETLRKNFGQGAPTPASGAARDVQSWARAFHSWRKENVGTYQDQQRAAAAAARDPEKEKHEREILMLRAAQLKLQVGEQTRQLVSRKDVIEFATTAVLICKQRLNAMVQRMSARLENVPGHVVAEELQNEVDEICNAFADGMRKTHGETINSAE